MTLTSEQGNSESKTQFLAFDLDLDLKPHPSQGQGCRSKSSVVRALAQPDGQTDGRYQVHYHPASRSIKNS